MMTQIRAFSPKGNTVNLTVLATTANVALTQGGVGTQSVQLTNVGTSVIFVTLGKDNTVTSSVTTGLPILPNTFRVLLVPNDTFYVAAIGASTGSVLYATTGESV